MNSAALFQLNVWSFAIPAAIISGYWVSVQRARQAGIHSKEFESALEWMIGGALLISHIVEIVLYQPMKLRAEGPLTLLKFWDGISSYGGFFGAIVVLTVYYGVLRRRRWWVEADQIIQGMVVAWVFGRFGCTMSGDHPGPRTDFFLAYKYPFPDGPRHNLGLYEMLFTMAVLVPMNLLLHRMKPPLGSFVAANCIVYGAGRFALDFLRATDRVDADPRYLGLTLAHYCSLALFVFGLYAVVQSRRGALGKYPPKPPPASNPTNPTV